VAILVRVNRLQEDALFDAVTSLRNHRYFQVRLREELRRSDRNGRPTGPAALDLDTSSASTTGSAMPSATTSCVRWPGC